MYHSQSLSVFCTILLSISLCFTACTTENGGDGNLNPKLKNQEVLNTLKFYKDRVYTIYDKKIDSAVFYSEEALTLSQLHNLPKEEAKWLFRVGAFYRYGGLYSIAENYLDESLERWENMGDKKWLATVYKERGFNNLKIKKYKEGLDDMTKALGIWTEFDSVSKIIDSRLDLIAYFIARDKTEEAWREYREINELLNEFPDESRKIRTEWQKATILLEERRYEEAISTFESLNDTSSFADIGYILVNLGDEILQTDSSRAIEYYRRSLNYHLNSYAYHQEKKYVSSIILDNLNLAGNYRRLGEYQKAFYHLEQGMPLAKENKEYSRLSIMYRILSDTYQKTNQEEKALKAYKRYAIISDSIKKVNDSRITNLAETHYKTEQIEKAKIQVEQENRIRTTQLVISILFLLLVAAIGIFYFYRARSRKIRIEQQAEINSQIVVDLIQEQTIENLNSRIEGQEEERTRIARELHDQLGGTLAAVKFSLEGMENKMPTELIDSYRKTHKLLQSATDNTRTLSHQMKALHLEDLGLDDSLQQFCDALNGNGSLQVHFNRTSIAESQISPKAELQLYRIAQELLQNVIKHAQASEVFLQLTYEEDKLTLMLEDDGKGFDTEEASSGMGMQNIQNRVAQIDGKLDFDSLIGQGTTVIIEVPTERD